MEKLLDRPAVKRVRDFLLQKTGRDPVVALPDTARTAADAAAALGVEQGAIVKSLAFQIDGRVVMALVSGDRRCDTAQLGAVLGLSGKVGRAEADLVKAATGFTIGGVAPVAHPQPLPVAIDQALGRFATVYAAAGHPHCVFATSLDELAALTGGAVTSEIGA